MDGIDIFIYVAYALVFVAAGTAIFLPLIKSLSQPKTLMTGGIGIGALLVIYLISWGLSGDEVTSIYRQFGVEAIGSKRIGGALTSMYLMLFLATIGIIASEIRTIFNK